MRRTRLRRVGCAPTGAGLLAELGHAHPLQASVSLAELQALPAFDQILSFPPSFPRWLVPLHLSPGHWGGLFCIESPGAETSTKQVPLIPGIFLLPAAVTLGDRECKGPAQHRKWAWGSELLPQGCLNPQFNFLSSSRHDWFARQPGERHKVFMVINSSADRNKLSLWNAFQISILRAQGQVIPAYRLGLPPILEYPGGPVGCTAVALGTV